jgi:hypothetical protein
MDGNRRMQLARHISTISAISPHDGTNLQNGKLKKTEIP